MKTLELKLKKEVLIVDDNNRAAYVSDTGLVVLGGVVYSIPEDYEFLCKGSELTEEIASELVDDGSYFKTFKNYITNDNHKRNQLKFAKESFISAVESKGFHWLKNPMSPYIPVIDKKADENYMKKYFEAEEKTFKNPLIFVKK